MYEAYSESKYRFAVKKHSSKISYKILLLSDSTFFKLFFHPPHKMRPPAMLATTDNIVEYSP